MEDKDKKYVIFLMDIDPNSGNVSQIKVVDYAENVMKAHVKSTTLSINDSGVDGYRKYYFIEIKH